MALRISKVVSNRVQAKKASAAAQVPRTSRATVPIPKGATKAEGTYTKRGPTPKGAITTDHPQGPTPKGATTTGKVKGSKY